MIRIQEEHESFQEIKKSKFITYLFRIESEDEAKQHIIDIKKEHPNANHHCYAFVLDDTIKRSNDDGEPSGTAGQPMLNILVQNNLDKILGVVVRYFGGIELGTGGLVRAYGGSLKQGLQEAQCFELSVENLYEISFSYPYIDKIKYFLEQEEVLIQETIYETDVTFRYVTKNDYSEAFSKMTNGQFLPIFKETLELEVPIDNPIK